MREMFEHQNGSCPPDDDNNGCNDDLNNDNSDNIDNTDG